MKSKIASRCVACLFGVVLTVVVAATAHADARQCSMAKAAGNWAFTDNGTVIGVGPRTAVGVFALDGKGNLLNGVATSSLNGSIADETFSGTYTVNSDCTGTISVTIFSSGVAILDVTLNTAFDDCMQELRALFTSVAEPNGTVLSTAINLQGKKQ